MTIEGTNNEGQENLSTPNEGQESQQEQKEEASPVKAPEPRLSKELASLAKRDRALSERENGLKEKERVLEEKLKELSSKDDVLSLAKKDPIAFLQKMDLSLEKLTDLYLEQKDQPLSPKIREHEETLKRIEREFEEKLQKHQEALRMKEENMVIEQGRSEILSLISGDGTSYEYLRDLGERNAVNEVFDLITDAYKQGKSLSIEQACSLIEQDLEEQAKERLVRNKKLRSLFGGTQKTEENKANENRASSNVPISQMPDLKTLPLDPEARKQAIMEKYRDK